MQLPGAQPAAPAAPAEDRAADRAVAAPAAPSRRCTGRAGRLPFRAATARAPLAEPPCITPPRSRGPREGRSARPPGPSPRMPAARLTALDRPKAPDRLMPLDRLKARAGIPPPRCQLPWARAPPGLLPRFWPNRRLVPRCRCTGRDASPCLARAAAAAAPPPDRAEPPPPLNFRWTGRDGRAGAGRDPLADPPWVDPARRVRAFSLGARPVPLSRSTAPDPASRAAAPARPGTPSGWLADPPGKAARPWAVRVGAASARARTTAYSTNGLSSTS